MCHHCKHPLVLWLAVVAAVAGYHADSLLAGTRTSSQVDEVLNWLPLDTETIIVAKGPFKIERSGDRQSFHFQTAAQSMAFGILQELKPKDLASKSISLAIEGSRCFRSPRGLGMMPYQGCQVIVFEEGAAPALAAAMQSLVQKARRTTELSGKRVAVFEERWEQDTWTLYVTQPKPQVVLCATHEGYLKDVLSRMEGKPSARAMPQDLPEWKYVDTNSPVWALRHYSKANAAQDPTSPLRDEAANTPSTPDPGAVGIAFFYDSTKKLATVRHVTYAKDSSTIPGKNWYALDELKPKIEKIEAGVVQITITIDSERVGNAFLLLLLAHLGHAVYL
jgi:hypothetical protein